MDLSFAKKLKFKYESYLNMEGWVFNIEGYHDIIEDCDPHRKNKAYINIGRMDEHLTTFRSNDGNLTEKFIKLVLEK